MPDNTDDEVQAAAAELVGYLRAHPEAADTLEGAARWWMRNRPPLETIERAITLLVSRRILEQHTLPEGTTVFRAGPMLGRSTKE